MLCIVKRFADLPTDMPFPESLREGFFRTKGAQYLLWREEETVCALRLEPWQDGLLLSGLETKTAFRRQGYAQALMTEALKQQKPIYSHIRKDNQPSMRLHEKMGFVIIKDTARLLDGTVSSRFFTLVYKNC